MGEDSGADRQDNLEKILEAVYLYHRGDREKVDRWLREPHPQLGGETPLEMIRTGRFDMLVDLLRMMIVDMDGPR